jgi:CBS domain containing-hemolysin-like protein
VGDSRFAVDAGLLLAALHDRLGLRLPTGGDYSTIGGLAFSTLGHLPEPGASFLREGIRFTVLEVEGHSIRRLQLDLAPSPTPAAWPA